VRIGGIVLNHDSCARLVQHIEKTRAIGESDPIREHNWSHLSARDLTDDPFKSRINCWFAGSDDVHRASARMAEIINNGNLLFHGQLVLETELPL
jgi:hypothetical protein